MDTRWGPEDGAHRGIGQRDMGESAVYAPSSCRNVEKKAERERYTYSSRRMTSGASVGRLSGSPSIA